MNKKFSASVIKNIHTQKIEPHSRGYFLGKNLLWAAAGAVFGVLGALGSGMIWYLAMHLEFLDFLMDSPSVVSHLFWFGVPMLWFGVAVAGAVALAKWFRSQGCGYRRRASVVLVLIFAVQVSAGFALEQSKVGERVDQILEQKMQWYRGVNRMHEWFEEHPEVGFLMGRIMAIRDDTMFVLSTRGQKVWEIEHAAELPRWGNLELDMEVRVLGEPISGDRFHARRVSPLRGHLPRGVNHPNMRQGKKGERPPQVRDGNPRPPEKMMRPARKNDQRPVFREY